jgi:hypothetical protein
MASSVCFYVFFNVLFELSGYIIAYYYKYGKHSQKGRKRAHGKGAAAVFLMAFGLQ